MSRVRPIFPPGRSGARKAAAQHSRQRLARRHRLRRTARPSTADYFKAGLERVTGDDHAKVVVICCQRDCWMWKWNAAKRAVSLGYAAIAWYPDGTDGAAGGRASLERGHSGAAPAQ